MRYDILIRGPLWWRYVGENVAYKLWWHERVVKAVPHDRGLGDYVAAVASFLGYVECTQCSKRRFRLNNWREEGVATTLRLLGQVFKEAFYGSH